MRTNHIANQLQYLNQKHKLYDQYWDQCLLMPDMIIAMNMNSQLSILRLNLDEREYEIGVNKNQILASNNSYLQSILNQ